MAVGGEYAENSLIQQVAFEEELHSHAVRFIRDRVASGVQCPVIVDHGAADGLTTCKLLRELDETPFVACLQDLSSNDWTAAAATLASMKLGSGVLQPAERLGEALASSVSESCSQTFVMAPGNFFEQVLPTGSVDLSISGSSYHWLSSTDHLPRPPGICLDLSRFPADMRAEWAAQARMDWATILSQRARELKVGGMLMAIVPCAPCMDGAIDMLTRVFTDFDRRGLLRPDAKVKTGFVLPAYIYRDATDLREGFSGLPFAISVCEVRPRRNSYLPLDGFEDASTATAVAKRQRFGERMAGWCFGWGARLIEDALADKGTLSDFRAALGELFAQNADAESLAVGMGCGVVLARRVAEDPS